MTRRALLFQSSKSNNGAGKTAKKVNKIFQAFRVEKVEYLLICEFVWPGGDIYHTRHIEDWFGARESFWLFSGAEQDWTKDFRKSSKFSKCQKSAKNKQN